MANEDVFEVDQTQTEDKMILKLRVSLKGRPLRTLSFVKDEVTVGRDPSADVALDNPGISREHVVLRREPHGYVAEDLTSANGTYVNDQLIDSVLLEHDDIIRVGKFSLWVAYEHGTRGAAPTNPVSANADQGTTVLSTDELHKMMTKLKSFDDEAAVDDNAKVSVAAPVSSPVSSRKHPMIPFSVGAVCGAVVFWAVTRFLI